MIRLAIGRDAELSLSGVASAGEHVFLAPDEGADLVRVTRQDKREYDRPVTYGLADMLMLPGRAGGEVDLEGLDVAGGYLWCVGSHSAIRRRVKPGASLEEVAADLTEVAYPVERRVLGRIPIDDDGALVRRVPPREGEPARTAACLSGAAGRGLRDVLAEDAYIGPFVSLPGKDNGLDVEGLVALGDRILVGLRGPVLRGWAVVVELAPVPDPTEPGHLVLGPLDVGLAAVHVLHFLDLEGLGVRDLARDGHGLLVLAGPTMVLDGPSRVLRIAGGARTLPRAVHSSEMTQVGPDLPLTDDEGRRPPPGRDHAEAIAVLVRRHHADDFGRRRLVVVYDSPAKGRLQGNSIIADTIDLPSGPPPPT